MGIYKIPVQISGTITVKAKTKRDAMDWLDTICAQLIDGDCDSFMEEAKVSVEELELSYDGPPAK